MVQVFTSSIGPLQLLLKQGPPEIHSKMEEARQQFLQNIESDYGHGGPCFVRPNARLIVLRTK